MELLVNKVPTHKLTSSHIYTLADGVISWQNKQKYIGDCIFNLG